MNIKRWFNNFSFFQKVICLFIICAAIPMLIMTFYSYAKTKQILTEQSYRELKQNTWTTERSLESAFQPYDTIMRMLSADREMNGYLCLDYTDLSFGELAYYTDQTINYMLALNANLKFVRFYSGNETLPRDNYYFFPKEELGDSIIELAENNLGSILAAGLLKNKEEESILLVSRMNYYSSDLVKTYLVLGIRQMDINKLLEQEDANKKIYLVDSDGTILAASGSNLISQNLSKVLNNWQTISSEEGENQTFTDGTTSVCIKRNLSMGMSLVVSMNQDSLMKEAKEVPRRMLMVFLFVSIAAFILILIYNRFLAQRVEKIVYATKKMGEGQFDYLLENMGMDEFGQISDALNLMNEQIQLLIKENYEKKLLVKSSEMNLLQEQINPHFLYNALSAISSVSMREGSEDTLKSVRYLADFYRMSLNKGRQVISIHEEVMLLQNYMRIQMIRFSDAVDIQYDIDQKVWSYRTIKLILQPLVENALHHGRSEDQLIHILVRAGVKEKRIFFEVQDDGAGIEPEKLIKLRNELSQSQEGFGLKNVDIRIKLKYGDNYGVTVFSEYGKGTLIHVEIPKVVQ